MCRHNWYTPKGIDKNGNEAESYLVIAQFPDPATHESKTFHLGFDICEACGAIRLHDRTGKQRPKKKKK